MINECAAVGGMRIGRGNGSTRRKRTLETLCPPVFPHDLGMNPDSRDWKSATSPTTNKYEVKLSL
jgi:hypothetical protein